VDRGLCYSRIREGRVEGMVLIITLEFRIFGLGQTSSSPDKNVSRHTDESVKRPQIGFVLRSTSLSLCRTSSLILKVPKFKKLSIYLESKKEE